MGQDIEIFEKNHEEWKAKLLDISFKNKLINYRSTKSSSVKIVYPSTQKFLQQLENNTKFNFVTPLLNISDKTIAEKYNQKEFLSEDEVQEILDLTSSKLKPPFVLTNLNTKRQIANLSNIYKNARIFWEEYSVEIMNLAVGFLEWYESVDSSNKIISPLFFIKVSLKKEKDNNFSLNIDDDDVELNAPLIRKLRVSFGLDIDFEIKEDKIIYEKYNEYVSFLEDSLKDFEDKRWKIVEAIELANFDFASINIVEDLEQNKIKILESNFTKKFILKQNINERFLGVTSENVEQYIKYNDYFHALDSDASQEVAIQEAINGSSFVLEGPPGTGKSQTITNIITELISRGKKVLFVAEKRAALDVVLTHIKKLGLDSFCLPIHNINIKKKEILNDLGNTLSLGEKTQIINSIQESNTINLANQKRKILNDYFTNLDKSISPIGYSLYELISQYSSLRKVLNLNFEIQGYLSFDQSKINAYKDVIDRIESLISFQKFRIYENSWVGVKNIIDAIDFINLVTQLIDAFENRNIGKNVFNIIKCKEDNFVSAIKSYIQLIEHFETIKEFEFSILKIKNLEREINLWAKIYDVQLKIDELFSSINNFYQEVTISNFDITNTLEILKQYSNGFKRLFSGKYKKIRKEFLTLRTTQTKKYRTLIHELSVLKEVIYLIREKQKILNDTELNYLTNINVANVKEYWNGLQWFIKFIKLSKNVEIKDISISAINNLISQALSKNIDFKLLVASKENLKMKLDLFVNNIDIKFKGILNLSKNDFINWSIDLTQTKENFENWKEIYSLILQQDVTLYNFFVEIFNNKIKGQMWDIFYKRYLDLMINNIIETNFSGVNSTYLNNTKQSFADMEKNILNLAKAKIKANLSNKLPNTNDFSGFNNEAIILKREIGKSRNLIPLRKLFNSIPHLLTTLKPCLMMSPLSISSYFKDNDITFDAVIFDEASQVKFENSIGALVRSNQWIIVGDRHQLPPTSFFQYLDDENSNDESIETQGFESVLNFTSAYLKTIRLLWHYRSKYEQLIDPSNNQIYKNLITFPNKTIPSQYAGVIYKYVNGIFYDNMNEKEAEEVIETLKDLYRKFGLTKSFGVVTFNNKQKMLIERKIANLIQKEEKYAEFFDENKTDACFIKNIETVQGDERDIIILSTCYGPNKDGRVFQRFGPINSDSGYRRLNVAITRAKECNIVISSLHYNNIKFDEENDTNSFGIAFFRNYLYYAEFGKNFDANQTPDEYRDFDSLFEQEVFEELKLRGYSVKKQVGCSGYKIDLAIVDPNSPNDYILGIECDGATYHSSKVARDRDRNRQMVLESKGWKIFRIWSTDWFKNKNQQIEKLIEFISSNNKIHSKNIIDFEVTIENKSLKEEEFPIYPDKVNYLSKNTNFYANFTNFLNDSSPILLSEAKKFARDYLNTSTNESYKTYWNNVGYKYFSLGSDNFIYSKLKTKISFRKVQKGQKRTLNSVCDAELNDALIKIIKEAIAIDEQFLFKKLLIFLGINSLTQTAFDRLHILVITLVDDSNSYFKLENGIIKYIK